MAAVELGRREIKQAGLVLIDQPSALLGRSPILSGDLDRRLQTRGLALDHLERLARLRGHDQRHAAFDDARLFGGDQRHAVAQELGVVERDRRDHGDKWPLHHIGCIKPAAESDLEQDDIGRMACEQHKRRRGLDLEHGDRRRAIGDLALRQRVRERLIADELAAIGISETEALIEAHQMRRGIDMHTAASRFEHRSHEGDGRALAIRARDMDDGRQLPLRMAERPEHSPHPFKRQVDPLRMKRQQARHNGINRTHDALDYSKNSGAPMTLACLRRWVGCSGLQPDVASSRYMLTGTGRFSIGGGSGTAAAITAGALVNSRHRLDSVSRNWRR
jgi:hypothetical protein